MNVDRILSVGKIALINSRYMHICNVLLQRHIVYPAFCCNCATKKKSTKKIVIVKPNLCVIDKNKFYLYVIYKLNFHQIINVMSNTHCEIVYI